MKRQDIINAEIVNMHNLKQLIDMVNINGCYEKVGDNFFKVERNLKGGVANHSEVSAFIDDIEMRPATAQMISFQIPKRALTFSGIKYSRLTDIFYTIKNNTLYKLPVYKRNVNATYRTDGKLGGDVTYSNEMINWEPSGYKDINGMSEYWSDVTESQISKFNLVESLSLIED